MDIKEILSKALLVSGLEARYRFFESFIPEISDIISTRTKRVFKILKVVESGGSYRLLIRRNDTMSDFECSLEAFDKKIKTDIWKLVIKLPRKKLNF